MLSTLILGAGCFWGVEILYEELPGVKNVISGYSGGTTINPRYKQVLTGETGHIEVVKIDYDSNIISFDELIDFFFYIHDPTTLDRQGPDIGEQYKSIVFYNNEEQKDIIEFKIKEIDLSGIHDNPIVTELREVTEFYPAEDYHQDYAKRTGKLCYQQWYVQYQFSPMPVISD